MDGTKTAAIHAKVGQDPGKVEFKMAMMGSPFVRAAVGCGPDTWHPRQALPVVGLFLQY